MKKLLLLISITLFIITCDSDSPTAPEIEEVDSCGVLGGDDLNDSGYHCGSDGVCQDDCYNHCGMYSGGCEWTEHGPPIGGR